MRLWRDTKRVEQLARLRTLEIQPGDEYGERAWRMAYESWRDLPDDARIDLPSARVFGRVLGLFRTGATLKTGKLLRLEISAQEIADLVGYSKSTVEAALRWLGAAPIEYQGMQLSRGLGLIHRGRRTARGYLEGKLRRLYRTSRLVLTMVGRLLLGLGTDDEDRKREQRQSRARRRRVTEAKAKAARTSATPRREEEHIRGQSADGGGQGDPSSDVTPAIGMHWLRKIQETL